MTEKCPPINVRNQTTELESWENAKQDKWEENIIFNINFKLQKMKDKKTIYLLLRIKNKY